MATQADAQRLLAATSCEWCHILSGMIDYAILAAAIDIGNGMPIPTDPNALLAQTRCLSCLITAGELPYVTLAVLIDLANGTPVPTDPQALITEADCLKCIPIGMVPYAILEALRNLP